ncbi:MAG: DsbA family oxidoreductase [Pseudomonadota bacterium]
MKVEIWSDLICPWCYIGKRRFESALAQFDGKNDVKIVWRSFELDPDADTQLSETLVQLLARKYGVDAAQAAAMNAQVSMLAAQEGLVYRLENARPGNTLDAHRLTHFAHTQGCDAPMMERLMRGYFSESLAIGERDALIKIADEIGMDMHDVRAMFDSDAFVAEVRADERRAAQLNIRGVPYFLIDEKIGISGAQSVATFAGALERAKK